ncbi:MAG: type II secretion system protein GspK [Proteobacteria bacterium]|nr:type II secretion system protein GspK [Pseudomonadota bacterium]
MTTLQGRFRVWVRLCFRFWQGLDGSIVRGAGRPTRRGVALLLVLTYVAVMSATVLSGFMNSQVSYSIASNVRDDLKAYYKAHSAMNLGRLMLEYQYDLMEDEIYGPQLKRSNFQMYQILDLLMAPFKSGIISVDVPLANHTIASFNLRDAGVDAMGEDSGDFYVRVFPEDGKLNLNRFATGVVQSNLYEFCMLFANRAYDDLFSVRSGRRGRLSRMELLAAMIDWVDADSEKTYITDNCVLEESSGDESSLYVDQRKRYWVKNAKLTTLDELYQVAGFGDDMMAAFGESLTVYPVDKINVNLASAKVLFAALCKAVSVEGSSSGMEDRIWACADPRVGHQLFVLAMALEGYQQFVSNPMNLLYLYTVENETSVIPGVVPVGTVVPFRDVSVFYRVTRAMIEDSTLIPRFLLYSPTAYTMLGEGMLGITSSSLGLSNLTFNTSQLYTTITTESPRIFRVVAVGEYGGTRRTLSAVIDFNRTGGRFLYWRGQ